MAIKPKVKNCKYKRDCKERRRRQLHHEFNLCWVTAVRLCVTRVLGSQHTQVDTPVSSDAHAVKQVEDIAAKSELDLQQVHLQLVLSGQAVKPLDWL